MRSKGGEKILGHYLYKIYYRQGLVYLGRTNQPIINRLRGHFFKKPMHKVINITLVTKIEVAQCETEADMYLYEIYYINKLKPALNRDDKSYSEITITLPELSFKEYMPPRMDIWKGKIVKIEEAERLRKQKERERFEKRQEARKNLKGDEYHQWLEDNGF